MWNLVAAPQALWRTVYAGHAGHAVYIAFTATLSLPTNFAELTIDSWPKERDTRRYMAGIESTAEGVCQGTAGECLTD